MNYSRILKFSLSIYILHVGSTALFTASFIETLETEPVLFNSMLYVVSFIISSLIYIYLARVQLEKTYTHAICVALTFWFFEIIVELLLFKLIGGNFNLLVHFIPILLTIFEVTIGTFIGLKIKEWQINSLTKSSLSQGTIG